MTTIKDKKQLNDIVWFLIFPNSMKCILNVVYVCFRRMVVDFKNTSCKVVLLFTILFMTQNYISWCISSVKALHNFLFLMIFIFYFLYCHPNTLGILLAVFLCSSCHQCPVSLKFSKPSFLSMCAKNQWVIMVRQGLKRFEWIALMDLILMA